MRSTSRFAQLALAESLGYGETYAAQLSNAGVINAAWWLFGIRHGATNKHEAEALARAALATPETPVKARKAPEAIALPARAQEIEATLAARAIQSIIAHHEALNRKVGRNPSESQTIRLAKAALAAL